MSWVALVSVILALVRASYQVPADEERIEKIFDIAKGDRVNIELAEQVGVNHLAVSYPRGVNCTLKKASVEEPYRTCKNVTVPVCKTVQKVRMKNVTEDCRQQQEYCQYNFRTQELTKQTIICQRSAEQVCDKSCNPETCPALCERNPIVVCSTVPQTVAITEKKQKCGKKKKLQTTKICFTYPDASWICKEPRKPLQCNSEEVRLVAHEVIMPRIDCKEKDVQPICVKEGCRLKSNVTDCLTTDIPTEVRLEDQICEKCSQGRTKLRPVVVQEEDCGSKRIQEICAEGVEHSSKWTKTCSIPKGMKDKLIQEIIEHTQDQLNEVQVGGDALTRKKALQRPRIENLEFLDSDSNGKEQTLSQFEYRSETTKGANVFFAKQFFKPQVEPPTFHSKKIDSDGENGYNLSVPNINGHSYSDTAGEFLAPRAKVSFRFDTADTTADHDTNEGSGFSEDDYSSVAPSKPTGVPYVYSDFRSEPGKMVTETSSETSTRSINPRFKIRPKPNSATLPVQTTKSTNFQDGIRDVIRVNEITSTTPIISSSLPQGKITDDTKLKVQQIYSTTAQTSTTGFQSEEEDDEKYKQIKSTLEQTSTSANDFKNEDIDLIISLLSLNNNDRDKNKSNQEFKNNKNVTVENKKNNIEKSNNLARTPEQITKYEDFSDSTTEVINIDGFDISRKLPKSISVGTKYGEGNKNDAKESVTEAVIRIPFVPEGFYETKTEEESSGSYEGVTSSILSTMKSISSEESSIVIANSMINHDNEERSTKHHYKETEGNSDENRTDPKDTQKATSKADIYEIEQNSKNVDSTTERTSTLEYLDYDSYNPEIIIQGTQELDNNLVLPRNVPPDEEYDYDYGDGVTGDRVSSQSNDIIVQGEICGDKRLEEDRVRCKLKACFFDFNSCF